MNSIGADNLAVVAGAGAGKTYMLVQRYLRHVAEDGLSPLEIVAVTYTEAAAAELRSRIRRGMVERFGEDDERIAELEAARIGTFHALAASICRQHFREAGVAADFSILDDILGPLWVADRLDDALDALPSGLYRRVGFTRMRSALRALTADPIAAESALGKKARHWKRFVDEAREAAVQELIACPEWQEARLYLREVSGVPGDLLETARESAIEGVMAFEKARTQEALDRILSARLNGGKKQNWEADVAEVKSVIRAVRDKVAESVKDGIVCAEIGPRDVRMVRQICDLRRAYRAVSESMAAHKRRERVLDYADIEVHALKALEHEPVRRYYHERWKAFLVDEYQDTNPVQDRLLKLLTAPDARTVFVGDPNQSIYSFRRAAPDLFQTRRDETIAASGSCETLAVNYRTHSGLVSSFNTMFDATFSGDGDGFVFQTAARETGGGLAGQTWLRRMTVGAPESGKAPLSAQLSRCEAMGIARLLRGMHESCVHVHDRKTDTHRALRWGDIAILTRTWKALGAITDALGSLGIPHLHAGGGSLMDTREARDGCALIRFLADPPDNLALAAVLKSPLFALSDLDLYELSGLAQNGSWWDALRGEVGSGSHPFAAGLLAGLLKAAKTSPPSRLLHMADIECGMTAILQNLPSGERRAADWMGFCDLVRTLEQESQDVFAVARILRRLTMPGPSGDAPVIVPRPALEAGDAVELMSVHRAKGLEWPVVVLAGAGATPRSDSSWLQFDPDIGVAVKSDEDDELQPCLFRVLRLARSQRELAETRRVAYVACTRARDYLFVTTAHSSASKRTLDGCLDEGAGAARAEIEMWPYEPDDALAPSPQRLVRALAAPQLCTEPVAAAPSALPVTALGQYLTCPRRFKYRYVDGHPGIGEGSSIPGRVGTLVHLAIQHAIFDADGLRSFDRSLDSPNIERALTMANTFRTAAVYAPYRTADAQHEAPISRYVHGVTLSGRIDLLGKDFVLDFKTGRPDTGDRYVLQLWLYGEATGRSDLAIAYLSSGKLVRCDQAAVQNAGKTADSVLTRIQEQDYAPTPSPDACAACRYAALCDARWKDTSDETTAAPVADAEPQP